MTEMHCHFCGGVIPNGAKVKYLPPRVTAQVAPAHPDLPKVSRERLRVGREHGARARL